MEYAYVLMSPANCERYAFSVVGFGMSATYRMKRIGPIEQPCGTPKFILIFGDSCPWMRK